MAKVLCFIDELGSGGAERQLVGLAALLKEYGYQVDVYCYHPNYFYEYYLINNNIKLIKESSSPKHKWEIVTRAFKVIRNGKYDVVISFSPGSNLASVIVKLIYNCFKLIVSERNTTLRISKSDIVRYRLYNFADSIVPNSFAQHDILVTAFPFLKDKITTITNFVDLDRFTPSDVNHEPGDSLKIMTVARHFPDKNINGYLEALKHLKDWGVPFHAVWYGNMNTPFFKDNELTVRRLNLQNEIEFVPPKIDIEQYYRSADVFCLPSIREGFPNVIAEAISSGLPILCGKIADNHIMVKESINGFLFDPYDSEDIARAIKRFADSPIADRINMSKASRKIATKLLSKDIFINKYKDLISRLITD